MTETPTANQRKTNSALAIFAFFFPALIIIPVVVISHSINHLHVFNVGKPLGMLVFVVMMVLQIWLISRAIRTAGTVLQSKQVIAITMMIVLSGVMYFAFGKMSYSWYHTTLYIDNGREETVHISLNGKAIEVGSKDYFKTEVPTGKNDLVCEGRKIDATFTRDTWILNPDRKYEYSIRDIKYSLIQKVEFTDKMDGDEYFGSDELFSSYANYFFEAPHSIRTKSWGDLSRTLLVHNLRKEQPE